MRLPWSALALVALVAISAVAPSVNVAIVSSMRRGLCLLAVLSAGVVVASGGATAALLDPQAVINELLVTCNHDSS